MGTKALALSAIVAVSLAVTGSHPANAQSYPERLIKIVVPFPAGGPSTSRRASSRNRCHRSWGKASSSKICRAPGDEPARRPWRRRVPMATRCCWAAPTPTPLRSRSSESEFRAAQRLHRGGPDRTRLQRAGGQPVRACENTAGTGAIREGTDGLTTSALESSPIRATAVKSLSGSKFRFR